MVLDLSKKILLLSVSRKGLVNSLPKGQNFVNLKALANVKANVAKIIISVFDKVKNSVGKGENAGYQHFLLFQQSFQKPYLLGLLKVGIVP